MAPDGTDHQTAEQWPRCEFGKTLFAEGDCRRPGEVQMDGSLLCVTHAQLLRLQVRENLTLGRVFEMDKWLENPNNRADQLSWQRVLHQRDEAVEQLRFNRTLIEAHNELDRLRTQKCNTSYTFCCTPRYRIRKMSCQVLVEPPAPTAGFSISPRSTSGLWGDVSPDGLHLGLRADVPGEGVLGERLEVLGEFMNLPGVGVECVGGQLCLAIQLH
jgi:hypothetical protein